MADNMGQSRRHVIRTGAAFVLAGAVAGCTGSTDPGTTPADDEPETPTETPETPTPTQTETATPDEGYSVSIEPMGTVEFESVPETWVANNGSWADMGIALGLEPPEGVWLTSRYHTQYYDGIPDVEVDRSGLTSLYQDGVSKELFYDFDADLHVMDPNFLMNRFKGWTESDIDEVGQIAPFFGNTSFSRGYPWHEDYGYYTLYEAFEKLAAAFQRRERYEAFAELHDSFQSRLDEIRPPESERPAVAVFWAAGDEPDSFLPYVIDEGTSFKQWRDLGVTDALAESDVKDFHSNRGSVDFETLLEIDPEVLLFRGQEAKTGEAFRNTVVAYLENHDVASDLTAVGNGDVYRGGPLYQGPIFNLVMTERAARQVYGVDEELFDRERVGDIVNGRL